MEQRFIKVKDECVASVILTWQVRSWHQFQPLVYLHSKLSIKLILEIVGLRINFLIKVFSERPA